MTPRPPSVRAAAILAAALALPGAAATVRATGADVAWPAVDPVGTETPEAPGTGTSDVGPYAGRLPVTGERTPLGTAPTSDAAALRMDNYVDVVDSVLNARVRTRRAEIVLPPARGTDTPSSDPTRPAAGRTTRVALPVHLPRGPLVVTTTAAFTGTGAPAGAASWPPASGRLSITATDGSRIELDADTGDIASVDVTIISGTRLYVFREPWATWAPYVLGGR